MPRVWFDHGIFAVTWWRFCFAVYWWLGFTVAFTYGRKVGRWECKPAPVGPRMVGQ